jgi:hypothetical protein
MFNWNPSQASNKHENISIDMAKPLMAFHIWLYMFCQLTHRYYDSLKERSEDMVQHNKLITSLQKALFMCSLHHCHPFNPFLSFKN